MKPILNALLFIKRFVFFIVSIVLILIVYFLILPEHLEETEILISLLLVWAFTAYVVLPKIHRFFTKLYLPNYFMGRARTGDGLLGDPVNIAIIGSKKTLLHAMKKAGWHEADPVTAKTAWKIAWGSLFGRSYPTAPVSDLFLFGKKQDLAFQVEVNNSPEKRHHVRFWRVPKGWYLPGGYKVDWLGAATYDDAVGLSWFTGQITHRIDPDIDKERKFLVETLEQAHHVRSSIRVDHLFTSYNTINGGGDKIFTDGSMIIVDLLGSEKATTKAELQHLTLGSMQQEIYNLAKATHLPVSKSDVDTLIQEISTQFKELQEARKTRASSQRLAEEATDIVIQSVQLIAALNKDIDEVYQQKMNRKWQRSFQKGDEE